MRKDSLKEFLRMQRNATSWRGGRPCSVCTNKRVTEINTDLRQFVKLKARGEPMPLTTFVRRRIQASYASATSETTIIRHARTCLKLKL